MKKVLTLFTILCLSCNLCFAGTSNNYSVKKHKSGSKTVKSGNTTIKYNKDGTIKYRIVESGNFTYIYDGKGKLLETRIKR